jgi:hypothetical protein
MGSLSLPWTSYNLLAYIYEPLQNPQHNKLKMEPSVLDGIGWALDHTSSIVEANVNHLCKSGWFSKKLWLEEGFLL